MLGLELILVARFVVVLLVIRVLFLLLSFGQFGGCGDGQMT